MFNVFPTGADDDGNPLANQAVVKLKPYEQYKLYRWADVSGPGPQCSLLNYSVRAPQ